MKVITPPHTLIAKGLLPLLLTAAVPDGYAQSSESQDQLSRLRDITRNSELILNWTQDEVGGETVASHRIYDLDLVQSDVSQRLEPGPIQMEGEVTGRRRIAVTTGNFTGSEFEHLASAWTDPDGSITLVVPEIDPDELDWTNAARISGDGVMSSAPSAKMTSRKRRSRRRRRAAGQL